MKNDGYRNIHTIPENFVVLHVSAIATMLHIAPDALGSMLYHELRGLGVTLDECEQTANAMRALFAQTAVINFTTRWYVGGIAHIWIAR